MIVCLMCFIPFLFVLLVCFLFALLVFCFCFLRLFHVLICD